MIDTKCAKVSFRLIEQNISSYELYLPIELKDRRNTVHGLVEFIQSVDVFMWPYCNCSIFGRIHKFR